MKFRLDRFVSLSLNITRKEAVKLIKKGEITLDGKKATEYGMHTDSDVNTVKFGNSIIMPRTNIWIMMNKPAGVISASNDKKAETVIDLVPEELSARDLFPCGRLDKDTTGLMLITNNGELAHALLAPKNKISKTYFFKTDVIYRDFITDIEKGILLDGKMTAPCKIDVIDDTSGNITLTEGKYHEVKRLLSRFSINVVSLKRISFAGIELDPALSPGKCRILDNSEIEILKSSLKGRKDV